MNRNVILLTFSLLFAINSIEDINIDYSGNILFGTVNRLSDGSIIKVPFRFFQVSPTINTTYVDIVSTFALQVNLSEDLSSTTYFVDTREFYINLFPPFGDVRLGKQIHSWGMLLNNNPTDNINPINYYYIFSRGTERKQGVFSLSVDTYFGYNKIGVV